RRALREIRSRGREKAFRRLDAGNRAGGTAVQDRGTECPCAASQVEPPPPGGNVQPREKQGRDPAAPPADVPLVGAAALPGVGNTLVAHTDVAAYRRSRTLSRWPDSMNAAAASYAGEKAKVSEGREAIRDALGSTRARGDVIRGGPGGEECVACFGRTFGVCRRREGAEPTRELVPASGWRRHGAAGK